MSLISKQSLKINNIGEGIVNQLLEESTPIIALYPGKFKPPHAGHFDVISKASKIADKVIVIMSNISKDEFTPEDSMKVWELYKDILPNNIQIIMSDKASPISEVFNIIKDKTQDFLVLYGKGERSRYKDIENDREKYSNVNIIDSGTFEDLHATDLRNAIRNKDLEGIQKYLPQGIDAKKVLSIYTQDEFKPGPILHELFDKDLPNIEKLNSYEYKVGNGDDIEAIFYFNFEDFDNVWSVHWKFTENNKNTPPEAWKQITSTSYKILKDFIDSRHPKAIHISGNTDVKTNIYKSPIIVNKLKTLFNNEYRVDNSDDFSIVLRSIEESAKSNIKKRMETMNESYNQALNYFKNGDIFSQSKIERNDTLKKYNSRKQISELYNIPFKTNILLEVFSSQKSPLMKKFVEYACNELNIDEPKINIINSPTYSQEYKSFGGYIPSEQEIKVVVHNRNMADILRTLAHELVHHMQNLNGDELNGEDGSETENQANAMAGVLMREFGRKNPEIFESKEPELFLNKDKFAHPKTIQQHLIENINEISLSKENAVDINGDLTGGTFKVGDITYEYNIKNIPNPYKDLGLFYNIQFTPRGEITSTPKGGKENYIKILSTMYKTIVDFLEKEKPEYVGLSSLDNNRNKNYHTVYNRLTDNPSKLIPGYFRKDANLTFNSPQGKGRFIVLKRKDSFR